MLTKVTTTAAPIASQKKWSICSCNEVCCDSQAVSSSIRALTTKVIKPSVST